MTVIIVLNNAHPYARRVYIRGVTASLLNEKEKEIRKSCSGPLRESERALRRFALFARVPCFIYQSARTSGCSNGLIMNYFVTRIRHCMYGVLSLSLSLFLVLLSYPLV